MKSPKEKKKAFIAALADYLCKDSASKSIRLVMGLDDAKEWAKLRSTTPLSGWVTPEEAVKELTEFLK